MSKIDSCSGIRLEWLRKITTNLVNIYLMPRPNRDSHEVLTWQAFLKAVLFTFQSENDPSPQCNAVVQTALTPRLHGVVLRHKRNFYLLTSKLEDSLNMVLIIQNMASMIVLMTNKRIRIPILVLVALSVTSSKCRTLCRVLVSFQWRIYLDSKHAFQKCNKTAGIKFSVERH
jgi:hypothetical protein